MKKLLTFFVLATMCAALTATAALAENAPINGNFTVSYTAGVVGTPPVCDPTNSVYIEAHGIGNSTGALGTMILTISKCFNYWTGTYTGSFILSSPDGKDSLTGTYAGSNDSYTGYFPGVFFPFHGVMTATSGTGKFRGAKGSMNFTAIAVSSGSAYYAIEGNVHGQ